MSRVINYDLQTNGGNYIHRGVRGKHFNRKGVVISLVIEGDKEILQVNTIVEEMSMNVADLERMPSIQMLI